MDPEFAGGDSDHRHRHDDHPILGRIDHHPPVDVPETVPQGRDSAPGRENQVMDNDTIEIPPDAGRYVTAFIFVLIFVPLGVPCWSPRSGWIVRSRCCATPWSGRCSGEWWRRSFGFAAATAGYLAVTRRPLVEVSSEGVLTRGVGAWFWKVEWGALRDLEVTVGKWRRGQVRLLLGSGRKKSIPHRAIE